MVSIIRLDRCQLKVFSKSGVDLHTQGQQVSQKKNTRTKAQDKLIGCYQIRELEKPYLDQQPLNREKQKKRDSLHQILKDFSLRGKQHFRVKKDALNDRYTQSVDTASEKGLGETIQMHKTNRVNVDNKTEKMVALSGSSLLLKRKNAIKRFKAFENGQAIRVDLGYITCSSKENLSEIDEEMESDLDSDEHSDSSTCEGLFNVTRMADRNNNEKWNRCQCCSESPMTEISAGKSICLSTSPFVLAKGRETKSGYFPSDKITTTLIPAIYGTNSFEAKNQAFKKERTKADCAQTFRFTIERRKVVSISKEVSKAFRKDGTNFIDDSTMKDFKIISEKENKIMEESFEKEQTLDKQTYMYIGLASARTCRNKRRRRHSFDHISNQRHIRRSSEHGQDGYNDKKILFTDYQKIGTLFHILFRAVLVTILMEMSDQG